MTIWNCSGCGGGCVRSKVYPATGSWNTGCSSNDSCTASGWWQGMTVIDIPHKPCSLQFCNVCKLTGVECMNSILLGGSPVSGKHNHGGGQEVMREDVM